MVKTSPQGPETKFGTLSNVVDQLKQTNQLLDRQGSALNSFIKEQSKVAGLARKANLESGRESRGGPAMGAGRSVLRGAAAMTGVPALGRGLSMILAPITSGLSFILKPLKLLGKLLIKGGPIGLIISGMYLLFKNIADNPTFNTTIESIKTSWNDSIVPAFKSIKESIDALMENVDIKAAFTSIGDWFTNFKTQIQDWVLGNLEIITDTISGVLEGIDLLLKGDWKAGLLTIGSTLFNGIKNVFDNTLTNILEVFGVDFGEGGTFLNSIGGIIERLGIKLTGKIREVQEWISTKWSDFTTSIKDKWADFTTEVKGTATAIFETLAVDLPNKVGEIKDSMIDTWNNIKSKITEALFAVSRWFEFKPKELGLLLEEKWVKTKGAFLEKLASFAGVISSIPSQLKLALLENLKETPLIGRAVTDGMLSNARADASSGKEFAESLVSDARSKTQSELERIRRDRIGLEMDKIRAERAATNIVQQISGGTTVNTTNLNPNAGSVADPYASSYMGHALPGGY